MISSSGLLTGIFVVALFILLFFGSIAYRQIESLRATERLISHSHDFNLETEKLFSLVKDAESGQRGFIITRDSNYLKIYKAAAEDIRASILTIKATLTEDEYQHLKMDSLFDLIKLRGSILESKLLMTNDDPGPSSNLKDKMAEGRIVMEKIRGQINTILSSELKLLAIREQDYKADISFAPVTYLFVIGFAIIIFIFSFFKISRDRIELEQANAQAILVNKELSKQNSIFIQAEETAHIGSFFLNLKSSEIKYSANLYHMLGYTPEEFLPNYENFLKIIHPGDKERAIRESGEILASGVFIPTSFRVLRKDHQLRYFTAIGKFIEQQKNRILIGTFQDITDNVLLNEQFINKNQELKKSEDRYHLMISEVQDYAIILLDDKGIIQNWNKGAQNIKGYAEEEIVGKPFQVFYTNEDVARKLPDQLLEEAALQGRATHAGWRVRKDGSKFWGNVVITALHDEHQNVIGFTKVTKDLTLQNVAEENLLDYNRRIEKKNIELQAINEEIASFNHIASHDLQEPLRKIQTFISRIEKEDFSLLTDKGREYFSRIANSANRMQRLIEDLIMYTHTNKGDKNFEVTDLNVLLSEVLDELKPTIEEKQAVINIEKLPTTRVIPFQFKQLFTNLIDNSLKYNKPDNRATISIKCAQVEGSIIPGAASSDIKSFYKISIVDNGIGFEPQYAETIFTLFQRLHDKSKYSGTGVGLAICKKIVENHNGIITAESRLNEGAEFQIYIPV